MLQRAGCLRLPPAHHLPRRPSAACAGALQPAPRALPTPAPPRPLPRPAQLAEIYDQAKEGMFAGTYIPDAMYSCGEHLAGPDLARRPTFGTAQE